METNKRIAKMMLEYIPPPRLGKPTRAKNLDDWGIERKIGDFILADPNALFFGSLFTVGIKSELAWKAPYELERRVGTINPKKLAKYNVRKLLPYMKRSLEHGPSLHRRPEQMAGYVISASKKIVKEYRGDASNIWFCHDRTPAAAIDVIRKLKDFDGIGQKISRMLPLLLIKYFGVALTGWNEIDVAVDRHVARVFLRTGLVKRKEVRNYRVSEIKEEVIQAARSLNPVFPGGLDEPAFAIGEIWCANENPNCKDPDEPCPIRKSCRKKTGMGIPS